MQTRDYLCRINTPKENTKFSMVVDNKVNTEKINCIFYILFKLKMLTKAQKYEKNINKFKKNMQDIS